MSALSEWHPHMGRRNKYAVTASEERINTDSERAAVPTTHNNFIGVQGE
jgi:hypothetical protein